MYIVQPTCNLQRDSEVEWKVRKAAMRTVATSRVEELSVPGKLIWF